MDGWGGPSRPTTALRGLHGQTVETIGSRIVRGRYAPGSSLPPEELEQEFGISKTVLREALRVLAAKGLVDARQKRGTVVRPRSSWSLLDADLLRWQGGEPDAAFLDNLAEVRGIVEPAGARLAASRRDDDDLDAMRAALQAMTEAGTGRMEVVIEAGLRARDLLVHAGEHWPDSVPVHRAILEAIEAGDGSAAAAAVDTLLEQASADAGRVESAKPRARTRSAAASRARRSRGEPRS